MEPGRVGRPRAAGHVVRQACVDASVLVTGQVRGLGSHLFESSGPIVDGARILVGFDARKVNGVRAA